MAYDVRIPSARKSPNSLDRLWRKKGGVKSDNKEPKTVPSFREVVSRNPSETGNMDSRLQMSGMTATSDAAGTTRVLTIFMMND